MTQDILTYIDDIDGVTQECNIDVMISIYDSLVKSAVIMEEYSGESLNGFAVFQEGIIDEVNKQGKNESGIIKAIKFLPRLLIEIVKTIRNKLFKKYPRENGTINPDTLKDAANKESGLSKALKALGIACTVASGGMLAFTIYESQASVEFKDDVKFMISADGSQLRISFPFYKIDGIKEFNNKIKSVDMNSKLNNKTTTTLTKLFDLAVINQARLTERDFTIDTWDQYYEKEITPAFDEFSKHLEAISKKIITDFEDPNNVPDNVIDLFFKSSDMSKKIVKDISLISKFNEKLHKTLHLLMNPSEQNFFDKKKLNKLTFEPIPDDKMLDMYQIDTTHLKNAIKIINDFIDSHKELSVEAAAQQMPLDAVFKEVEQQFNCKIKWAKYNKSATNTTARIEENKITFSRTKGFDLGGTTMWIMIDTRPEVIKHKGQFVGQTVVGIICHEIFHNISAIVKSYNNKVKEAIKKSLSIASSYIEIPLEYAEKFAQSFMEILGLSPSEVKKQDMIEKISTLMSCNSEDELKDVAKDVIRGERINKSTSRGFTTSSNKLFNLVGDDVSMAFISGISTIAFHALPISSLFGVCSLIESVRTTRNISRRTTPEEHMCDVFAALYKLPLVTPLAKKMMLDKDYRELKDRYQDEHPSTFDRNTVSYNLAKEMLYSGKITDQDTKDYLQYVIDKHEGANNTERHLTKGQLKRISPAHNSNINRIISNYINDNHIGIKE